MNLEMLMDGFLEIIDPSFHMHTKHISDGEIYLGAELTSWTFQWDLTL